MLPHYLMCFNPDVLFMPIYPCFPLTMPNMGSVAHFLSYFPMSVHLFDIQYNSSPSSSRLFDKILKSSKQFPEGTDRDLPLTH